MTWLKDHDLEVAFVVLVLAVGCFDPALGVLLTTANIFGVMLGFLIELYFSD